MVDVQTKLTDLREEAYAKVLKCLPYPRQWVRSYTLYWCNSFAEAKSTLLSNCFLRDATGN